MGVLRPVGFSVIALLITTLLFLVMTGLIRSDPPRLPAAEPVESVTIAPVKFDKPVPRVMNEPPAPVRPPPPMDIAPAPSHWVGTGREMDFGRGPFRIATQGAIALVAIDPVYPIKALRDGTTGWVRVQFTIEPDGTVSDTAVIDAEPKHGIFDSAALGALYRSRFVPKTVNGVAVASRAEWTFTFTNDEVSR